jgi:hypothetical protein
MVEPSLQLRYSKEDLLGKPYIRRPAPILHVSCVTPKPVGLYLCRIVVELQTNAPRDTRQALIAPYLVLPVTWKLTLRGVSGLPLR